MRFFGMTIVADNQSFTMDFFAVIRHGIRSQSNQRTVCLPDGAVGQVLCATPFALVIARSHCASTTFCPSRWLPQFGGMLFRTIAQFEAVALLPVRKCFHSKAALLVLPAWHVHQIPSAHPRLVILVGFWRRCTDVGPKESLYQLALVMRVFSNG